VPEPAASKEPFPKTFYVANVIELFERMAFYGMYIGLSYYMEKVAGFSDQAGGDWLGIFRAVASLAPIPAGAVADRISFKRSLILAFSLYAIGYGSLFSVALSKSQTLTIVSLMIIAIAGGFMKPVISGTVVRTSPPGRQTEGFGVFYRMINAGSVVGKILAYGVRAALGVSFVMINSVVGSLASLGLAALQYEEPERGKAEPQPLFELLAGYGRALRVLRFTTFLVIFAGFYFMAEQFYFTLPKYILRTVDEKAPLELIGLVNPAVIAIFQGLVARVTRRFAPIDTMIAGMLFASLSMFAMGLIPGMLGAIVSAAIFACAEMTFSPRFYDYIASFAPKGKAGMFMGLGFVPAAIGALVGGRFSGYMVGRFIPAKGMRLPQLAWWSYAAIGVGCVLLMLVYRFAVRAGRKPPPAEAAA
jgi:POT family proton-dependent oligopeptide transporter